MQKTANINMHNFHHVIAIAMAISLFVAGRFGFFDILGLKRIAEVILFVPLIFLAILFLLMAPIICLRVFFLLPFSYFIFQLNLNPNFLMLADLSMAIFFITIILALGSRFADVLLRYLIIIASIFAFLGIIEFFILLINPALVTSVLLFYDYYSGSNYPVIDNAMQLLGLADGTSYHLWGLSVTRLRSFTSEPSLLVGYFLIPGALGLTYRNRYATLGLICIFFCVLSLSGSVYASLACAIACSFLVLVKRKYLTTLLPFFFLVVFFYFLYSHYADLILLAKKSGSDYDFLDKTNSANVRFSYIRDFIPKVISSPFGVAEEIHQPLGLLIGSAARAGIIGLTVAFIILTKLYAAIDYLMVRRDLYPLQQLGLLIVYGALITGLLYLDNCFIQLYGFTLLLLTYCRLINMRGKLDNK